MSMTERTPANVLSTDPYIVTFKTKRNKSVTHKHLQTVHKSLFNCTQIIMSKICIHVAQLYLDITRIPWLMLQLLPNLIQLHLAFSLNVDQCEFSSTLDESPEMKHELSIPQLRQFTSLSIVISQFTVYPPGRSRQFHLPYDQVQ